MRTQVEFRWRGMGAFLIFLLAQSFQTSAATFDIGLDGSQAHPANVGERLDALLRDADGRQLNRAELDEFKAILVKHGWPTYRTSGPASIEVCAGLLKRSGLDFDFQKYMLAVLDQQVGDDIRPAAYARIADQAYTAHEGVQLYGTLHRRVEGKVVADPPVKSEGTMLFFRDFYGLPSLEEELAESTGSADASSSMDYDGSLSQPSAVYTRPDIRKLLGELIDPDQSLRHALSKARAEGDSARVEELQAKIAEADRENTRKIKQVFDEVGFPTREMVGIDGVSTALLLVQHADEDPEFQKRALTLAEPLMKTRGMSRRQYAMLTDRVALASGHPQIFGTQMMLENGTYVLQPTLDLENLDRRRREMALGPYRKMLESANSDRD
ncbi:DUF6624 domain-containing protein [Stenotrophomonas acidaminiphila]|uniref:DUF6624 domain-containing protein n=1 Tax=Stenotrophomonas acidaminiphila TaxID=128780 RepID=UPI0020C62079|nr:DUF6624 domain-containing protein [Stenotrophomonas acidaminiphila]